MKLRLPSFPGKAGQKSVGLDIGFHSIKVVELAPAESGFEILKFAIKEIPRSIGESKNKAEALGKLVKTMFEESGIQGREVYLSVSGHNVVIRNTELPNMPKEELTDATRWAVREEVLFDVDQAAVDNYVMGEVERDGARLNKLLSVIVRGDIIPFLANIVDHAGMKSLGVTIIPLALWDYDQALNKLDPGTVTSYIDMGAERTRIYFVSDNELLFSREIPNGGKNLTSALTGEYEVNGKIVSIDDIRAENIKKTYGLPKEDSLEKTEEGIPLTDIRERLEPIVTKQLTEFARSFDYFRNQYKKDAVNRVILSGGAGGLKGLYQFLSSNLAIEIERCNALMQSSLKMEGLTPDDIKRIGPSLTTAAGLALGRCDKINVLPEELRYSVKKSLVKWAPFSAIPIGVAVMVFLSMGLRDTLAQRQAVLKKKQTTLTDLQKAINTRMIPTGELANLKKSLQTLTADLKNLPESSNPVNVPGQLREIARLLPENGMLTSLDYNARRKTGVGKDGQPEYGIFLLKGIIFGDEQRVLRTLTNYLSELKKSKVVKKVELLTSEAVGTGTYSSPGLKFNLNVVPLQRTDEPIQSAMR